VNAGSPGPGWWQASDLNWYPPQRHPDQPPPSCADAGAASWQAAGIPPGPPPHASPGPSPQLASLRSNKLALYLLAGMLGGALGALLAEVVNHSAETYAEVIVQTGLWFGIVASVLAMALFVVGEWHQRRELRPPRALTVLCFGALAGFIAGGVAEAAFQTDIGSLTFRNYVLRTLCWGLAGALLGALLSRSVPNLGFKRGIAAGLVGGALGGICFLLVSSVLPDVAGRVVGIAALGLALGLAMYVVENLFREASLEVEWAPHETTRVGLGAQPVTIGGGEDHIFVRGLPPHVASIVFSHGHIEHIETASGKRTPLKDGSRLQIGTLQLVVHAAE
jgi:MFS family permease